LTFLGSLGFNNAEVLFTVTMVLIAGQFSYEGNTKPLTNYLVFQHYYM